MIEKKRIEYNRKTIPGLHTSIFFVLVIMEGHLASTDLSCLQYSVHLCAHIRPVLHHHHHHHHHYHLHHHHRHHHHHHHNNHHHHHHHHYHYNHQHHIVIVIIIPNHSNVVFQIAAQNCRKRKLEQICCLESDLGEARGRKETLVSNMAPKCEQHGS